MKGFTRILLISLMALGLAACGGSGDSSSRHESVKSGFYSGALVTADFPPEYITGYTSISGFIAGNTLYVESYNSSYDRAMVYLDIRLTGTSITATGRFTHSMGQPGTGYRFSTGGTVRGSGTLEGTDITMHLERSDGIVTVLTLKRDAESGGTSSLDLMEGAYQTIEQDIDINFSATGAFSGSETDGCTYSGDVDIIDPSFNVYALNLNIASCDRYDGDYKGVVSRDKSDGSIRFIYEVADEVWDMTLTK